MKELNIMEATVLTSPNPLTLICSKKEDGSTNLAPICFVSYLSFNPPMALAKELAPSDIQVNAIACGAIDTEMNGFLSEEEHEMLLDEIPAGRMGKPEEVADLVLKLVEAPDYLTGQVIKMDGGWI